MHVSSEIRTICGSGQKSLDISLLAIHFSQYETEWLGGPGSMGNAFFATLQSYEVTLYQPIRISALASDDYLGLAPAALDTARFLPIHYRQESSWRRQILKN